MIVFTNFLVSGNYILSLRGWKYFPVSFPGQRKQICSASRYRFVKQLQILDPRLYGSQQGLGLLTAQTLIVDVQIFTLDTVYDGDQVAATDIHDFNFSHHTGDQGVQVLRGN